MSTSNRQGNVIVFDFDRSLINENSDVWIIKQLGSELMPRFRKLVKTLHFTDAMDEAMKLLFEKGVRREDLENTFAKIPFYEEMREGVKKMKAQEHALYILSDANTFFISTILSSYGLSECFKKVYSNKGEFDEKGCLRVSYFHPEPHGCSCPKNLCKGKVLREILEAEGISVTTERKEGRRVLYVGDGANDECPSRLLASCDVVMARKGYKLCKALAEKPPAAKVEIWHDGKDALALFKAHVLTGGSSSQPSSVRKLQSSNDYSFLVCGQHPTLVKELRSCLEKEDTKEAETLVMRVKTRCIDLLRNAGILASDSKQRPLTIGVSFGTIHKDVAASTTCDEDIIIGLIMDPLDIDCKQLTFIRTGSISSRLAKAHVEKLLYKLQLGS